ncbi:MAG: ion channel [bacterium]|nr:ion channel [bacterium]
MAKKSDPGLGTLYNREIKRMVNPDGSYNLRRRGALRGIRDLYKYLIELSWWMFLLYALLYYLVINCIFSVLYLLVGVDGISGINRDIPDFFDAFFFSVQTFTSVGYGTMSPTSFATNLVGTLESFAGLMSIALITGLLYGRFSRPTAKIAFSKNILITPYKDGQAMMFKMVNKRDSTLLSAEVKVILFMDKGGEDANQFNKEFHRLDLELEQIHFFPLSWTIVHAITEDSPFWGMTVDDLRKRNAEVLILVEAFDETHSQSVKEKKGYGSDQWLEGYKFDRNFRASEVDGVLELHINELDNVVPID